MIHRVRGILLEKKDDLVIVEVGGIALKVFVAKQTRAWLPDTGKEATLWTHLHLREDALELYGFSDEAGLGFFELLISISGVGPKSALAVMDVANLGELASAIKEGRPDLLTKASGIGRKTAERIIVELRNKVEAPKSGAAVKKMESDSELAELLTGLGYKKEEAREALAKITEGSLEERLKQALGILGGLRKKLSK